MVLYYRKYNCYEVRLPTNFPVTHSSEASSPWVGKQQIWSWGEGSLWSPGRPWQYMSTATPRRCPSGGLVLPPGALWRADTLLGAIQLPQEWRMLSVYHSKHSTLSWGSGENQVENRKPRGGKTRGQCTRECVSSAQKYHTSDNSSEQQFAENKC